MFSPKPEPLVLDWKEAKVLENALFWHRHHSDGQEHETAEKIEKWLIQFNTSLSCSEIVITAEGE